MDILDRVGQMVSGSQTFTMLEIGAYDGAHTRHFLSLLEGTRRPFVFHAFEPVPQYFATVRASTAAARPGSKGVFQVHQTAVGAANGEVPFYISGPGPSYPASSSLRPPTPEISRRWRGLQFSPSTSRVCTLDQFAVEHLGDAPIDFIWADIQGAEIDLIKGGRETFKRVRHFYTEYYDVEYYVGAIGLAGIGQLLPDFDIVENYGEDVLFKNRTIS